MAGVSIVTHTEHRSEWFEQAVQSVFRTMPAGCAHLVIDGTKQPFAELRWEALQADDLVGFVDDDDLVEPGAIELCALALQAHPAAGVAFTDEALIDSLGMRLGVNARPPTLRDVAMTPMAIHHFALLRRSMLDDRIIDAARRVGTGIDWLTVAWLALRHGAVHVPIVGYQWRQHPAMHSTRHQPEFVSALPALRAAIHTWGSTDAPIHRFLPRDGAAADAARTA